MVAPPCTTVFVSCIHVYVSIYVHALHQLKQNMWQACCNVFAYCDAHVGAVSDGVTRVKFGITE